ncbi:NUDIX hydrolase [Streptomyces sp. TP-A0874]|uniref:NUDIX hydrolase n=1 Tax=Streptomyces sp. TP-A0874 TaxID=549819 RepID=UPI000852F863|nr:NUDIX domain-containing protein [Streptomyces sp. TP-A0874]
MSAPVRRRVARVVLFGPQDRILLMYGFEPSNPRSTWWFTPGGGVEPGETREAAARREVEEETGIRDLRLGPVLWQRNCSFVFDGRRWEQDEWFYLGRTEQTRTETTGQTELERRSVAGLRWWTVEELFTTHETVYPMGLAELLHTLLADGPPSAPVTLEPERN